MAYSLSTKLLEYVAMGVPVVATDLRTFRAHFDGSAIATCPETIRGHWPARSRTSPGTLRPLRLRRRRPRPGAPYAWAIQKDRYLAIVGELVARGRLGAPSGA